MIPIAEPVQLIHVAILEQLFDKVPEIAFFVKNRQGLYVAVNQSLLARHGLKDKSQAIGKRPLDICPNDFGRIPTEQDRVVLTTGKPMVDHLEMQWYVPNEPVWCLTTKLPVLDVAGTVVGIVGFSRDVRVAIDKSEVPKDFAKTLESFEAKLPECATPSWLAEQSKLTPQRFARLIKKIFDLTPSQYIAKTRIAAAMTFLLDSEKSVSDVALECGFYDHSAFSRAFRQATGLTPREYRRHHGLADGASLRQ